MKARIPFPCVFTQHMAFGQPVGVNFLSRMPKTTILKFTGVAKVFCLEEKVNVYPIVVLGHTIKSNSNDPEVDRLDGGYSSSSRDTSVDLENNYRQVRLQFL